MNKVNNHQKGKLYRITTPYAVAGVIILNGRVIKSAPILRMYNWTEANVLAHVAKKNWGIELC